MSCRARFFGRRWTDFDLDASAGAGVFRDFSNISRCLSITCLFCGPMAAKQALDHSPSLFACVSCKIDACFLGRMRQYNSHLLGVFSSHLRPRVFPSGGLALIGTSIKLSRIFLDPAFLLPAWRGFRASCYGVGLSRPMGLARVRGRWRCRFGIRPGPLQCQQDSTGISHVTVTCNPR